MPLKVINIKKAFEDVHQYFSPRIIGELDNQYVKIARIFGEDIPWHHHENEDELFYIIEGELLMEIENQAPFIMQKEALYIVKKGVKHRISSKEECLIMLIESKATEHTGKIQSDITKSVDEQHY